LFEQNDKLRENHLSSLTTISEFTLVMMRYGPENHVKTKSPPLTAGFYKKYVVY